ncbi:hypothetical protein Drorol1_Dr00027814 [Drosera rotundifolia]
MEKEFAAFDKLAYNEDPGAIRSPSDAKKRLAMRQAKIEQLMAEADAILSERAEQHVDSRTCRNLNLSYNSSCSAALEQNTFFEAQTSYITN